jgi:predicted DCC family thiol-disulfide oxidoreductase YuxK
VTRLTILYDARCGFCVHCRRWLERQRALVELEFVPAGSDAARRRFPGLGETDPPEDFVVVDDEGGVYREGDAFILCLYALEEYREWSFRLAGPRLRPLARVAFEWLSRNRRGLSRSLGLSPDDEVVDLLRPLRPTTCPPSGPGCDPKRRPA